MHTSLNVNRHMENIGIEKVSVVKFWNILDIAAKTGHGSKMIDRVRY